MERPDSGPIRRTVIFASPGRIGTAAVVDGHLREQRAGTAAVSSAVVG